MPKLSSLKQQLLSLTVSVGQEFRSDLTGWLRILPEGLTAADRSPSKVAHLQGSQLAEDLSSCLVSLCRTAWGSPQYEAWLPPQSKWSRRPRWMLQCYSWSRLRSHIITSAIFCWSHRSALSVLWEGTKQDMHTKRWGSLQAILDAKYHRCWDLHSYCE